MCGCVGVWVCGCVGVWVCGCVGVRVCGCEGLCVCFSLRLSLGNFFCFVCVRVGALFCSSAERSHNAMAENTNTCTRERQSSYLAATAVNELSHKHTQTDASVLMQTSVQNQHQRQQSRFAEPHILHVFHADDNCSPQCRHSFQSQATSLSSSQGNISCPSTLYRRFNSCSTALSLAMTLLSTRHFVLSELHC